MKFHYLVLSLLGLFGYSGAQIVQDGQCNRNIHLENFNADKFAGTWYEIRSASPTVGECATIQITRGNGQSYNVNRNAAQKSSEAGTLEDGIAKFKLNLDNNGHAIDVWILATDYKSYALAYSCQNISPTQRSISVWQLGRTSVINDELIDVEAKNSLRDIEIDIEDLQTVDYSSNACAALFVTSRVLLNGQCGDIPALENFNVQRFTGRWYQIEAYRSANSQGDCNQAEYVLNNGVVDVTNSEVIDKELREIKGTATVASEDGSAKLNVILEVIPGVFASQFLYVLATDYDNYAVLYTCENVDESTKQVYVWINSRKKTLSEASRPAVNAVFEANLDLSYEYLVAADQSDKACFYYPKPDPTKPVEFAGTCNQNIKAMPNFDPAKYLGLWHTIESYPTNSQRGNCNNAYYSLGDGVVDVYNTEVVDQTLESISGDAVVVSDDGSGILLVTFILSIDGIQFPSQYYYYVMDTDYTSYALVYSCQNNTDGETKQVFSWKLSRTKQLPEDAKDKIDKIIDPILELDQRYYVPNDQSPEGCFYMPEPTDKRVIFPGQCDENMPVVRDFNMTLFEGIWHEFEAYPKEQQTGQCISHDFRTGADNTLTLQSTTVYDVFMDKTDGVVEYSSTDNSAKLTLTTYSGGNRIEIPYWILATDYSEYALAYSCVNIAEDFRAVYSWKLTRTKQQLSLAAITAINNVMESSQVLDNKYHKTVNQSDEACSYLAELKPGEPVIIPGQCPEIIDAVKNFEPARYLGRWYLIETYPSAFQDGDCNDATYSLLEDGSVLVYNTQIVNETLDTITGRATLAPSDDGSGKLIVTFPDAPFPLEYVVLDTDYESYSIVQTCFNINSEQRQIWSWKLSRTKTLSADAKDAIKEVVKRMDVLNDRYYQIVKNSDDDCFYFPDSPRDIRGQCNENIAVVQNFDPVRYQGKWYDIESYPQEFQMGTCSNALYTLNDGVVDVYNTQVVNQELDYIYGKAVLASDDGSAKLEVTFPIAGTNFTISTPYWVLATDYDNYSLVYSCVNKDPYTYRVSSWKLSRSKELSAAASEEIEKNVEKIKILDDRYYVKEDQSPEGCFYYPEPTDEPVIFPGRCNENMQVVSNFNMTRFEGIWHEIEAYPKEQQTGQCINHRFTEGPDSTLILQSTSVTNQNLGVTNGLVAYSSTENNGKMTLTFPSGSNTIQIPYWILDTDYTDYALAYSCVNLADDYRAVYSWKLSRNKQQLSADATAAINNFIDNVQVLDKRYFKPIAQSQEACFVSTEPSPGKPVIVPGQCNPNVAVVKNFEADKYFGRWHLIESYPSAFQDGECTDATYTPREDGSVSVFNTQVINQTLDAITGTASVIPSDDGSAKLEVTFDNAPSLEYWILATDYSSYSLVYGCRNVNEDQQQIWSWKLSRTKTLSNEAADVMERVIDSVEALDKKYYLPVDNSDKACFYYPEPTGEQVVFRGQCDLNIDVVQDFSVARYQGRWYEIGKYPQQFQFGTCGTANYSPGDGVVDVLNTQVINERLYEIEGTAVPQFSDGSGKLLVTFPVAGTDQTITTTYWVLATDYDNYALVYSCVNLDSETRRVTSWKLSRTKSLTEEAETVINKKVEEIDVLDPRYYELAGQSNDECFYYPEYDELPKFIELPGSCPENIKAQADFDAPAYLGKWYEWKRYPTGDQSGECGRADYSLGDGVVDVSNTQVVGEKLLVQDGYAFVASEDGTGKLEVVFNVSGVILNANYYVMNTDYENYAIVYSCRNTSDGNRIVSSWILSRGKAGLSDQAKEAVNEVVDNTQGLSHDYYLNTSQSEDDCFYYPEYDVLPDFIELPGSCPSNITAQADFDLATYSGRWYEVARYPTGDKSGGCGSAEYSPRNDVIDVYNYRVVGEKLLVQEGYAFVASEDGSGELTFILNVDGVYRNARYYVLRTDYKNYAIVYSCENANGNSIVSSWVLSRGKSGLSDEANEEIKDVIDNTKGLLLDYYLGTGQSVDDCFYYPEFIDLPKSVIELPGPCPESIKAQADFDAAAYLGRWYEMARYPTGDQSGECAIADYSLGDGVVDVHNTQVVGEKLLIQDGYAYVASEDGSGKLEVVFDVFGVTVNANYYVMRTDYKSFALVYSCRNTSDGNRIVSSWVLSREKEGLSDEGKEAINEVVDNTQGLSHDYYLRTGQSNDDCFYYPEYDDLPNSIILPGPCPDSIKAQADFDAPAYLGRWYEVKRYPTGDQSGECARAEYSLGEGVVDVHNTQVVGEKLLVQDGYAFVASEDGSGKLEVVFNVSGIIVNANYYVLKTDYRSHAIVYSCRNTSDGNRIVSSWVLSRGKLGLSDEENEVINDVIDNTQGLHQDYYLNTSQSDENCFYVPEMDETQYVTFRGKCENIRGVQNFDLRRYVGWWHEIERFPRDVQPGECTSARFQEYGNQIMVVDTSVIDQNGQMDTSTVTATNDGRLRRTYSDGGVVDTWVLATDYSFYSLLYSCEDFVDEDNNEYRRVWSAKHSKLRELTNFAQDAMAPIIENNRVLYPQFYVKVDQSNDSCFYYPEPSGRPVIMPGQCDENIPVVQNFQAGEYTGTWYQIERYPQFFETSSECTGARYSLDETTGVVELINWEVINGELDTITGNATVVSNDGSAKLEVVLPNRGEDGAPTVTTSLYVLTTDYTSYSLAYSCVNVNEYERQLGVWKLSRYRAMETSGNTAINNYIASRLELNQQYFVKTNHYDDCLEPSSGVLVKSSVIVLLVCALAQLFF